MRLARAMVGVLVLGGLAENIVRADETVHGWRTDFAAAQAEARRLGQPLLLHFSARWCGPCQRMEAETLNTAATLEAFKAGVVAVKVDSDRSPGLVAQYGVTALPTDLFIAPDGRVLSTMTGYKDQYSYRSQILQMARYATPRSTTEGIVVAVAETPIDERTAVVGLRGYSPVSLTADRQWVEGQAEFSWQFEGTTYYMANAQELHRFQQNPGQYAPQLRGCDPMILKNADRAVPGNYRYAAFYRGRLYLFYAESNRKHFSREPARYLAGLQSPRPEQIELTQVD